MSRSFIVIGLILLTVAVGCSRYIDSRDPVQSLPGDPPVPTGLSARSGNGQAAIAWEVSNAADIAFYRIFVADSTGTGYALLNTTTADSITVGELIPGRRYFFRVAAVMTSGLQGDMSAPVTVRVRYLSIAIEDGNRFANSRQVKIRLYTQNDETTYFMLSEDAGFADASYLPFVDTVVNFTLSDDDTTKTVYARLLFSDGSMSADPISDEIILDTRAQIDSVFFTYDQGNGLIKLGLVTGETGGVATVSFGSVTDVPLYDDGTYPGDIPNNGIYNGIWVVPAGFSISNGVVTGAFTDAAGNVAFPISAQQFLNVP
ncbi:MAG: fibronectin type III domain-containing protein [bacterium]